MAASVELHISEVWTLAAAHAVRHCAGLRPAAAAHALSLALAAATLPALTAAAGLGAAALLSGALCTVLVHGSKQLLELLVLLLILLLELIHLFGEIFALGFQIILGATDLAANLVCGLILLHHVHERHHHLHYHTGSPNKFVCLQADELTAVHCGCKRGRLTIAMIHHGGRITSSEFAIFPRARTERGFRGSGIVRRRHCLRSLFGCGR
ncbi:hypothetical protein K3725_21350 (plasmid) [Leisingera sp. S132]|uniref:hypothetical protein n=1 Tax=Leisingera sp. S132 TaxID=2867016 RepID=UPI0021A2BC25|nr:hypothetical protein [Leisingera sp. S132]UWQ81776.1 hypothetical protein K3725_21350 [Leisingera sp. S132]